MKVIITKSIFGIRYGRGQETSFSIPSELKGVKPGKNTLRILAREMPGETKTVQLVRTYCFPLGIDGYTGKMVYEPREEIVSSIPAGGEYIMGRFFKTRVSIIP
ncbi:hypothetical protein HY310_03790 [Candidatus Microgenomates bacterium]|nr:hypothetical protein [Candidatus Microgenomates bacterium]